MYKLLLVDDEIIIREGIEKMIPLERYGIQIMGGCSNAFEALDYMLDEMPDILICDIKMPKMDGLELIRKAKSLYPNIQTIVLSGYDEFEFAREALKLGVKEYLLKPCEKSELLSALERVCNDIDIRYKKMNKNVNERNAKISHLKKILMELGASVQDKQKIQYELQKIMEGSDELFTEALVQLVVATEKLSNAQQQVEMLQKIYDPKEEDIISRAVQILRQIYFVKGAKRPFVEQMRAYAQEKYMEPNLTLQYVADNIVHMNADYIGKEFAHDMGMKFSKYLLEVRIKHAQRLIIKDTLMPFYEVADKVGFGDNPQYFSLMFKKVTGMTAKEFRDEFLSRSKTTEN